MFSELRSAIFFFFCNCMSVSFRRRVVVLQIAFLGILVILKNSFLFVRRLFVAIIWIAKNIVSYFLTKSNGSHYICKNLFQTWNLSFLCSIFTHFPISTPCCSTWGHHVILSPLLYSDLALSQIVIYIYRVILRQISVR